MKTNFRRRALFAVTAVVGLCFTGASGAQSVADNYPEKPIKIIVPFAPGGSVDTLARVIGQKMQEHWGQPVLVESRPGASTLIGTTALAHSPADGYTLIISVSNHTTNPAMRSEMPYDTLKDFQPISLMARTPIVAYANPDFEADNLAELMALAKKKPGTINFGSAGAGSMTHLTAELMKQKTGIDIQHVVYKGGTPALMDTIAGHIPMTFATVGQALQQYKKQMVKPLGISSEERYPSVPEIPTFKEQGIDLVTTEWFGLLAPAGTPPDIVAKLNTEVRRIVALPGLGDRLNAIELVASSPEELGAFIQSEMDRWTPLIQELGLKVD
ncbi:tripartite tricarboxylate transporter substrate binding protein [Pusillimonas sp. SM2304]|uniref:Bug family tripartite tricarboxylate transporter substrate binding protein n=1 Tax=Pusillimonas sp. SM2304 TaxID=3073241 RepID=UPI0028747A9B|nr:tripartite tricarboxylate transporter substrate binding protein [Pusillimonas sp. SM2304]MDS1138814.1 tripartite tricarboxylate transporter substrate binding protein [Pusillimonas sp. SM2304]